MIELNPCPFCGGEAKLETFVSGGVAKASCECNSCGARTRYYADTANDGQHVFKAINAWNKRTIEQQETQMDKNPAAAAKIILDFFGEGDPKVYEYSISTSKRNITGNWNSVVSALKKIMEMDEEEMQGWERKSQ